MAKGVRVSKTKIVVSLPVLAHFLREFLPGRMIPALAELSNLGLEHFEASETETEAEKDKAVGQWLDSDYATDLLWELFLYRFAVEDLAGGRPVQFSIDSAKQTLTLYLSDPAKGGTKRKRREQPRDPLSTTPLPLRLLNGPDSHN